MASTRELWILLRARDEASRVVSSFSKNVRAAALAARAAQKSAEAAAIRQQAQMLKTNGVTAQQIRAINDNVIALEKQARANTLAAATARERRAKMLSEIGSEVKSNNLRAANLERQARALSLASSVADEHRQSLIRVTGATNENVIAIDNQISALRKRAATLNAEAAVYRGASNSLIANVERESVGLENSIRSYERRAAAIRAQASILRNQAAEQKVNLDTQVRVLTNQAAALDKQANALRQSANAVREHDNRLKALNDSLGKVSEAATVAAFSLGAVGVGGLIGLKQAIDTTVEYDRQVRATATQVDGFGGKLEELGDIGRRIANEIAVPFESIQPALFDIFSSMDVSIKDSEKLLRAFSKAAVAGQVEIQDVSRATIGLLNAFNRPASDVTKILDIQFQLIQEGIGTYEEWNQRIGLVTPSAVRAGQSIEVMMAALATATRMGMSAARSGTAVARAMDAMSHPAAVKNLENLGIKVRDARGRFLPMNEVLRDFRTVLMKLPEKDRLKAILDVFKGAGGTIEARRFLQNILLGKGTLELFDDILKETSNSAGSMEQAYGIMADGTAAKTDLLRNKWQLLKEAIGSALLPGFNSLIDTMQKVLDWFNRLPQGTKNTIAQFLLWGSAIAIVLGGMFALIGIVAVGVAAIASLGAAGMIAIGILTLLPVAVLGIVAALTALYKNSPYVQDLFQTIKDTVLELWSILQDFGSNVSDAFEEKLLPALRTLGSIIETQVMPTLQDFYKWFSENIIPKIREAADTIGKILGDVFKKLGEIIENIVIPAIRDMTEWWNKNKESILPVVSAIASFVKNLIIWAAVIAGVVIVAIAALAASIFWLGSKIIPLLVGGIKIVIGQIKLWWAILQTLWNAFKFLAVTIVSFQAKATAAIFQVGKAIKDAFASAGKWLYDTGRDLINGLINGIKAMVGQAKDTVLSVGRTVIDAAKSVFGIHSPSKVFHKIGVDTIRGLINGINGSRKQLLNAMYRIQRDVIRALTANNASSKTKAYWNKRITGDTKKLMTLETQRAVVNTKLAVAQKSLNEQLKARSELSNKIFEKLSEQANLFTLSGTSPQAITDELSNRLAALKKFQQDLMTLKAKGLDAQTIAEIAEQGVEQGGKLAGVLAKATPVELQRIAAIQDEIRKTAKSVGNKTASDMYDAGIKAAQGLIKGLQSQSTAITKQMMSIANALIKSIKKSLGIKSPSKVFQDIGKNTALGYVIGYKKAMASQASGMYDLMSMQAAKPMFQQGSVSASSTTNGTQGAPNYSRPPVNVTVHTSEIDPRKTASDLGWELQGRL